MFSFPISEWIWPKCGYMLKQIVFGSFYHPFQDGNKKFHKTDIVSMASPGQDTWYLNRLLQSFLYARTVTKSWCSVSMFFDRCTNCKFINWYPDVTIWILVQCTVFWLKRIWNIIIQVGIFREYRNKCFWRPKCFRKGTTSVGTTLVYGVVDIKREGRSSDYAVPDIKQEGRSSDYVVSEIKREMPISPSVLHA